jgi:hypothetical protein
MGTGAAGQCGHQIIHQLGVEAEMKAKHNRASKKSHRKSGKGAERRRPVAAVVGIANAKKRVGRDSTRRGRESEWAETNQQTPKTNESGDLTGVGDTGYSAGQSTAELMEEGQDLEGELVLGVENAAGADEEEVPTPRKPRSQVLQYRNRNRL